MRRYLLPSIPFLFTIPAAVIGVLVMVSWFTDTHDTCDPYQPFWNGSTFLWAPCLGVLGGLSGVIVWTPETSRPLRFAGPGFAILVLGWSAWFFLHSFKIAWCV